MAETVLLSRRSEAGRWSCRLLYHESRRINASGSVALGRLDVEAARLRDLRTAQAAIDCCADQAHGEKQAAEHVVDAVVESAGERAGLLGGGGLSVGDGILAHRAGAGETASGQQ